MIKNYKIALTPANPSDFDLLISWVENAEQLRLFSGTTFTYPLTHKQLIENASDVKRTAFMVVDQFSGEKIGYAELYKINAKNIKLARLLICSNYQGQGYGTAMIMALTHFCFAKLKAKQVELNVYAQNTKALKCYSKLGFELKIGYEKTVVIDDFPWTSLRMQLTYLKWRQNREKKELETL